MSIRRRQKIPSPVLFGTIALLASLACTIETEQPNLPGTTVRLTILRTADIHSRIFPYDLKPLTTDMDRGLFEQTSPYGGVERVAALIERERRRGERTLYLDSGDVFQGAPIFNFGMGEPEFRWLSLVPADAMVVGNHEFDQGAVNLTKQTADWVGFPFLAANYIFDDWTDERNSQLGRYLQPYVILNAKGLRVAVIGLGDISSMYSITEGGNSAGITPVEQNEATRAYLEFLRPSVDLILVLSHLGLSEDQQLVNGHEFYLRTDQQKNIDFYLNRPERQDRWVRMPCPECTAQETKYWIPGVRGIDAILGGHLHVLLHPPMVLTDPAGRKVLLEHPGAFAKYMTRLDLAVAVPDKVFTCDEIQHRCTPDDPIFNLGVTCERDSDCNWGAEIVAQQQEVFPIDSIWCAEPRPTDPYADLFNEQVKALTAYCGERGSARTRNLLEPYRMRMETDPKFDLTRVFGYAPKTVLRRNSGTGGDAPLGNMTALSMMIRRRVEAEFAVTNTLGIRDNLYPGLINMETIFNVFPFENTITIMYLSGREVQELFDFVTERSGGRGCQSQAQIAGCAFTMNCGQDLVNRAHNPCSQPADCCSLRQDICPCSQEPDCSKPDYNGKAGWECNEGACYSHPAEDILMNNQKLNLDASYKLATNDYIAKGGSGFKVLKRNTTKVFTGIALRDALVEYLMQLPTCNQLFVSDPNTVDTFALSYCIAARANPGAIVLKGSCRCSDALERNSARCGAITTPMLQFCERPLDFPTIVGKEDGRIRRKVR